MNGGNRDGSKDYNGEVYGTGKTDCKDKAWKVSIAKNNELIYQGTEAMIHGNRIHRSAYLEQFYGVFKHDADLRECIGKMIRVDVKPETITESNSIFRDMSDWEKMRPRVCCQIINRARNLKLLRKVSNTEYLDL